MHSAFVGEARLPLRYEPPYDWAVMLEFLRARAIPGVEEVAGGVYARAIDVDGEQGVIAIEPGPGDALHASIHGASAKVHPAALARVTRVFDLGAESRAIREHLARDPLLAPLVAARPGLRVPGAWDGFELAIRAVLGQQITVAAARTLAGRLVVTCGEPLSRPIGTLTHVFPTPGALAAADLSGFGVPRARAAALLAVARATLDDARLFDAQTELDQAVRRFRAIRGIGEWTAQYIALRHLRLPDAFPSTDLGLLRGSSRQLGRKVDADELLAMAESWRPWRAYAAQYLWSVA